MTFENLYNRLPIDLREAMESCIQDQIHHNGNSVTAHTEQVFNNAKETNDIDLMIAAILHDIGKPETRDTKMKDGIERITHYGHEYAALKYMNSLLDLYDDLNIDRDKIIDIVTNHMKAHLYTDGRLKKVYKRKAFEDKKYFKDIIKFSECDEK